MERKDLLVPCASGVLQAKSIKKTTGLQVVTNKTVGMPVDAMKPEAYDGNDATYISNVTNQYIKVNSSMAGKKVRIRWKLNILSIQYT